MAILSDILLPAVPALTVPLLLLGTPETGRPVLVVAPPGSDAPRVLELIGRAEGQVLHGAGAAWMAVAVSDRADFPQRLRAAGAWVVVNASGAAGCPPARAP